MLKINSDLKFVCGCGCGARADSGPGNFTAATGSAGHLASPIESRRNFGSVICHGGCEGHAILREASAAAGHGEMSRVRETDLSELHEVVRLCLLGALQREGGVAGD